MSDSTPKAGDYGWAMAEVVKGGLVARVKWIQEALGIDEAVGMDWRYLIGGKQNEQQDAPLLCLFGRPNRGKIGMLCYVPDLEDLKALDWISVDRDRVPAFPA